MSLGSWQVLFLWYPPRTWQRFDPNPVGMSSRSSGSTRATGVDSDNQFGSLIKRSDDSLPFRTTNPAIRTNFAGPDHEWRLLRRLTGQRTKTSLTNLSGEQTT
jgi:hypothetical protein